MEQSIKILVVEDNPYDAELLREMLLAVPSVQFEWIQVSRLHEAIHRLGEESFDAILLDLSLPDSHGKETLAKAYAQAQDIPIVVLTGHSDEALAIKSVHQGAQDYLVKGQVDGPTLVRSIRYAIERHRLMAELDRGRQQQLRLKDQFLSHVSHELRSPLAVIYQFVTILLDRLAGDLTPQQNEYLEITLRNVNQLRKMIEDLLEVTRAEAGKLGIYPQLTPMNDLLVEILGTMRMAASGKGIELLEQIALDLPFAYADPNRIRQILMNLIDNAIKFTPEKGRITVRARVSSEDPHYLCISVADTGRGIPAEETQRIFESMYQGADSPEVSRKGLGLGLFICKELVLRHGGRIWVESEPGQGSTFFFTLPVFSLTHQLASVLNPKNLQFGCLALISVEVSAKDKRQLTRADEGILRQVGNILKHCTLIDKDFLLPRIASTPWKEVFIIIALAPQRGAEILKGRIDDQLSRNEKLQEAGLEAAVSFKIFEIPSDKNDPAGKQLAQSLAQKIGEHIRNVFQEELK